MRGSETVLIADDHESIREMARQTLAGLGYRVLCAADGEEGLRRCEPNTPQIAVLDVVVPKQWLFARPRRTYGESFAGVIFAEAIQSHEPGKTGARYFGRPGKTRRFIN